MRVKSKRSRLDIYTYRYVLTHKNGISQKSALTLKATYPLGIKVLVAIVWHTGHPLVLAARTSNANTSATKHGLALLRVLKSLTLLLLLLLRLLLHHLWHEFSDLVCRDTKTTKRYESETSCCIVTSPSHHSDTRQHQTECKSEAWVIFQQKQLYLYIS